MELLYSHEHDTMAVALDVTNNCNFRCVHCFNNSGECNQVREMKDEEFLKLAEDIIKLKPLNLCFCGGETLIKVDLIYKLLDIFRTHIPVINIVSNGYFFTPEVAKKLKKLGISGIQFSLDGAYSWQHDSFRQFNGAFNKVFEAIKIANDNDFIVDISFVPNRVNYMSLPILFKELLENKLTIRRFNTMPLIPMGRGSFNRKWILEDNEMAMFIQIINDLKVKYQGVYDVLLGDPIDHYFRMKNNYKLGVKASHIGIRANGDVVASPYVDFIVSNVRKKNLVDIWEDNYKNIWGNVEWLSYIDDIYTIDDLSRKEYYNMEN